MSAFQAVRTVGTVLPAEALSRAADLRMPGQGAQNYDLTPGMAVNAAIARAWDAALGAHRAWKIALDRLPGRDSATALTRDKWLLPLLYELGYGRPEVLSAGLDLAPVLGETQPTHYPISRQIAWPASGPGAEVAVPIHLVGGGVTLDSPTPGVTARAPQSMVQDFLNHSRRCLWGIVSNGHTVRLLRDASSLTKQSYVEFDLDDIFDNQRYAEFRLFFLTIHASRLAPIAQETPHVSLHASTTTEATTQENALDLDEGTANSLYAALLPESCWLEQWRTAAIADGTRALDALRDGVALALTHLGTGFVSYPGNGQLRAMLTASPETEKDLHRALLRIAYRLIVLFVAEDRRLLHTANSDAQAQALYNDYYSTRRLRHLAMNRTGTRHTDLWDAHLIVADALAGDGLPALALPGLAATLFDRDTLGVLTDSALPNRSLLAAVRALAQITDPKTGTPRPVDYRNLGSEELGGVYEGLLAYTPRYDSAARTFSLDLAAGNDRKKSGSYYTPSELIALVLDEALDPVIKDALRAPDREAALLDIAVLDPAVGSGHFVVAAARRIAAALAVDRTGDSEPGPQALRTATAEVIERCIYGVDLNDLAIEITKVALWLEAFDGSRPFPFLDAHLRVGNSLLGTTPALLRENIPDTAFTALGDDDKTWTSKLKARNKAERERHAGQSTLSDSGTLEVETVALTKKARVLEDTPASTLVQARARADAWRRLAEDPELAQKKLAADAWCAAFVQPKSPGHGQGITHDTIRRIVESPGSASAVVVATVREMAQQYRFFHWHLEFPGIFTVPGSDTAEVDSSTGWQGGFSCVIGNPPWERVKIQDKEFFSSVGRNDIAEAKTAAIRRKMIDALSAEVPPTLHDMYRSVLRTSDGTSHLLLHGGRYPLTGRGDVNTYSVFAETFRTITGPTGTAGIISPTGLATDKTTAPFFADTLGSNRLIAFYDFENEAKIFPGVHHAFRFAVTAIAGRARSAARARFAFLSRHVADVQDRRFELAAQEILALNPNTGTLPMFRGRTDADITLSIYRRHPILIRDGAADGNPWRLSFVRLFDMANDSGLFRQPDELASEAFNGWSYEGETEYLPLYEAKLLWYFDDRFSTYRDASQAQLNMQTLPRLSDHQHDDPNNEPLSRYWVARPKVAEALAGKWKCGWLLGWRDITGVEKVRTFVPSVLPTSAVGDKFLLAFPENPAHGPLLHAAWSTLACDYVARQKISGTAMKYFVVKQIACPSPHTFAQASSWQSDRTLAEWVIPYVLELSYTSWRLQPYAWQMDDDGPPFRWDPDRRSLLRADLDAAMLHVYGLTRVEAEHVLDSFPVVRKYEERDHGEYRTRRLVLEAYDRMAAATARSGSGWTPLAGSPAGKGPRHAHDSRASCRQTGNRASNSPAGAARR